MNGAMRSHNAADSHTSADPVPDVEDKAEDHKDPSPTGHSAANRVVGKDVEQGRIGKDDQPEERDEEAVECTVHPVRENPDQRESNSRTNPASNASRHPIRRPFSPAHGVSLSTRHCGSARAEPLHPLRVNAPTRVKHTTAAARLCCRPPTAQGWRRWAERGHARFRAAKRAAGRAATGPGPWPGCER